MKPSVWILLLVSVFCLPARAQRPPYHPNTNNLYSPDSFAHKTAFDPHDFRSQQVADPLFMMGVKPSNEGSPPIGTVSARQLLIPGQAMREFKRGNKAYAANDFKSSAEHFEKAAAMYPGFAEAQNNLGASYLMMGEYEKSAAELERAIALDPKPILPYSNLSLALLLLKRYPDSENAARRALQIDPRDVASLSLLGNALVAQEHFTQEAADSLRQSGNKIPEDRLTFAGVLLKRGQRAQAIAELRAYLQIAPAQEKQRVQCWLAQLTQTDSSRACSAQ